MHLDPAGLVLGPYRGGLALTGTAVDAAAATFGTTASAPAHITLLTAAEMRAAGPTPCLGVSTEQIYVLGVGGVRSVRWAVVVWNHADAFGRTLGLGRKQYHVILTDDDDHTVEKGMGSLQISESDIVDGVARAGESALDHTCVAAPAGLQRLLAERMIMDHPASYKGYARLAGVGDPKTACLAYAAAARLNPALTSLAAKRIGAMRAEAPYGPVVTAEERAALAHLPGLFCPWPPELHDEVGGLWTHPTTSRTRQTFGGSDSDFGNNTHELPRFFSWVYPGRIAGLSTPRSPADVAALAAMGVTDILTLTAEQPLPEQWVRFRVRHTFVPVPNLSPPTLAEMDAVWARISAGGVWAVHCGGGVGRAGTVLACLVAMLGREGALTEAEPRLDARTAITLLRSARPRSLETRAQESFVAEWVSHRWRLAHAAPPLSEPAGQLSKLGNVSDPLALILIGRPGSGKSWLGRALRLRRRVHLIGDEEGRASCERAAARAPRDALVVLDRCNPSAGERRAWLALLDRATVGVFFDYPLQLCRQRVDARLAHPTLRAGRGQNALAHMDRALEAPTLAEGFVGILTIPSLPAARAALAHLAPMPLAKFPRTPHLLDLGAATPDDLHCSAELRGSIVVEEKIDGANMGISLDEGGELRVQNRSHWVCAADHAQWRALPSWIATRREALTRILTDEVEDLPGRYVLYGEWMAARHSVKYTRLPGHFIAFDMYDRVRGVFLSRAAIARALHASGIPHVPLLAAVDSLSEDDMMSFLSRVSMFGEDRIEGIYVRVEDPVKEVVLS